MSRTLPSAALSRSRRWALASRSLALHLTTCRAPIALTQLVGCAVLLRIAVQAHTAAGGGLAAERLPVLIEGVTAAVVAGTCHDPLVRPRAGAIAGRPLLRLCAALVMTVAAFALPALATVAQRLPGGEAALLRNTVGLCGLGMAGAALLGTGLAWVGPAVVTVLCEVRLAGAGAPVPAASWLWPVADRGNVAAALCAGAVFAAGAVLLALRAADGRGRLS
jgi:hypothetical protein